MAQQRLFIQGLTHDFIPTRLIGGDNINNEQIVVGIIEEGKGISIFRGSGEAGDIVVI